MVPARVTNIKAPALQEWRVRKARASYGCKLLCSQPNPSSLRFLLTQNLCQTSNHLSQRTVRPHEPTALILQNQIEND